MDCRETQSLVRAYIDDKIPPRKLEEFIEHVEACPSCYDELETYYTLFFAMKYLDEDRHSSYNIKEMLSEDLKRKMAHARYCRRRKVAGIIFLLVMALILLFVAGMFLMPAMTGDVLSWILGLFE